MHDDNVDAAVFGSTVGGFVRRYRPLGTITDRLNAIDRDLHCLTEVLHDRESPFFRQAHVGGRIAGIVGMPLDHNLGVGEHLEDGFDLFQKWNMFVLDIAGADVERKPAQTKDDVVGGVVQDFTL